MGFYLQIYRCGLEIMDIKITDIKIMKMKNQEKVLNYMLENGSITFREAAVKLEINNFTDTMSIILRTPELRKKYEFSEKLQYKIITKEGNIEIWSNKNYKKEGGKLIKLWKRYYLKKK